MANATRQRKQNQSKPVKLTRDVREIDFERFRLPTDGRQWKHLARDRQTATGWLATFGDGDGTRIFPGLKRMAKHFGWSERKCDYLAADLKALGILIPSAVKRSGPHGNKQWEMVPSALTVEAQSSHEVAAQSSIVEAQNTMLRPTVTRPSPSQTPSASDLPTPKIFQRDSAKPHRTRSRRNFPPHEALQILNALTASYPLELADSLASWVSDRIRSAHKRNPVKIHNPAHYFREAAWQFLEENEHATVILENYQGFADRHGCLYCPKINAWRLARFHDCLDHADYTSTVH